MKRTTLPVTSFAYTKDRQAASAAYRSVRRHSELAMDWEVVGATGEWAGAVAVIATLFYLARQIRQSNNLAKAEAERDFMHTWHNIVRELGSDVATGSIVQRGLESFSGLSAPEKAVFNTRIAAIFNETELASRLCEQGLLAEERFHSTLDACVGIVITTGGDEWWRDIKPGMPVEAHVERRREELGEDAIPFNAWLAWKQ